MRETRFNVGEAFENELVPERIRFTAFEDSLSMELEILVALADFGRLPEIGSKYKGTIASVYGIRELILTGMELNSQGRNDEYWRAKLTYSPAPLYDESKNGVRKVYELSTEDMDVPLEQHRKYRMKWNHVLVARRGTSSVPGGWDDARTSASLGENYKWAKPGDPVPEGWYVLKAETKPGVESFRSGVPTVTLTKTSLRRDSLQSEAKNEDYTRGKPGMTFGFGGEWLRCGSSIRRNGRRWELNVRYINAKEVDHDLYTS